MNLQQPKLPAQARQRRLLFVTAFLTVSASLDRRPKDVRVLAVIVTELELGNIKRHIFAAHFMECADYAALEDRPEAFDGLRMNCADDILTSGMINHAMRIFTVKTLIAGPLIGAKQADFVGDGFADERGESVGSNIRDHASDHIALAADSADDWSFARTDTTGSAATAAFIPMSVFGQAADESFIDFDNSAELINVLHERGSDFMAHEPSDPVGTKTHISIYLQSAHAFLAGEHQVDHAEPLPQRFICVLENRSGDMGEAVVSGGRRAFVAQCQCRSKSRPAGRSKTRPVCG